MDNFEQQIKVFSPRLQNCLLNHREEFQINKFSDLKKMADKEFLRMRNFGRALLKELRGKIKSPESPRKPSGPYSQTVYKLTCKKVTLVWYVTGWNRKDAIRKIANTTYRTLELNPKDITAQKID